MASELARQPAGDEVGQLTLLLHVPGPQVSVVDLAHAGQLRWTGVVAGQEGSHGALVEPAHRPAQPGGDVDAVGDGSDRMTGHHLPRFGGGLRVQLADRVGVAGVAQDEGGHVERRVWIVGAAAAELQQLLVLHAGDVQPRRQVVRHQPAVERLVARGDRGVDGEHRVPADLLQRLGSGERAVLGHQPRARAPAAGRPSGPRSGATPPASMPSSPSARTPPTPRISSWQRRISRPRTYRMWVIGPIRPGRWRAGPCRAAGPGRGRPAPPTRRHGPGGRGSRR